MMIPIFYLCFYVKIKVFIFSFFQKFLTPASYWHDDTNEARYKQGSSFLAVINNENQINKDYIKNLHSLKRFVLVKYVNDISLIPNESAWFGFKSSNGKVLPLESMEIFTKNKLGLQEMMREGRLIRLESPLEHLRLDETWFRKNIIPFLTER
jgi:palmitoyl-protein thioesterase